MLELATKPILKLGLIDRLFEELHEQEILYCHWKSNEHLQASVLGETDLDVLFDKDQKKKIESLLGGLGFKKFNAVKQKTYSDIVDYLGFDEGSGKIIHLHTHYRLSIGKPYLKEFQFNFNIEKSILASRVFYGEYGIFCIQPACELILLNIREALKLRRRDMVLMLKNKPRYNEFVLREYKWLKDRVTEEEVSRALRSTFPDYPEIYPFMTGEFSARRLYSLASVIKKKKKLKALYSPFAAPFCRWYREATVIFSRKVFTFFDRPTVFKRINPRGGLVAAVIGADGSGKSTVTESIKSAFEPKLDVYKIYFGRGDGKASRSRQLLKSAKGLFRGEKIKKEEKHENRSTHKKRGFLRLLHKCTEALLVAQEKRSSLRFMEIAKHKGMLVICDRYPQNQIRGYNDGPLLHDLLNSRNPLLRSVAKFESGIYSCAENHPPDIVFKLVADADVVEKRKPGETSLEKLKSKIDGIRQLKFKDPCKIVTVDASRPLAEVLYLVKKEIWNML